MKFQSTRRIGGRTPSSSFSVPTAFSTPTTATDAKDGETEQSEPALYSYTIVTVPADKTLTWLHDRMPAILRTPEEAAAWLDSEHVPFEEVMTWQGAGRSSVSQVVERSSSPGVLISLTAASPTHPQGNISAAAVCRAQLACRLAQNRQRARKGARAYRACQDGGGQKEKAGQGHGGA
jgi:hypothetical protein